MDRIFGRNQCLIFSGVSIEFYHFPPFLCVPYNFINVFLILQQNPTIKLLTKNRAANFDLELTRFGGIFLGSLFDQISLQIGFLVSSVAVVGGI